MPTALDTHAWVWWVTEDPRLSRRALQTIQEAVRGEGIWLSAISIWEVAKRVEKKQLVLDRPVRHWIDQALGVAGLRLAELSPAILLDSCALPQPFHGDSSDQIIVASARHIQATLVTRDSKLRKYPHVQTIW